jgi:hypothetical protein
LSNQKIRRSFDGFKKIGLFFAIIYFSAELSAAPITLKFDITLNSHKTYQNTASMDPVIGKDDAGFKPKSGKMSFNFESTYAEVVSVPDEPGVVEHRIFGRDAVSTENTLFVHNSYEEQGIVLKQSTTQAELTLRDYSENFFTIPVSDTDDTPAFYVVRVDEITLNQQTSKENSSDSPLTMGEFLLGSIRENRVFNVFMKGYVREDPASYDKPSVFNGDSWSGEAKITSSTGIVATPLPAAFWLMFSGIMSLLGFTKLKPRLAMFYSLP